MKLFRKKKVKIRVSEVKRLEPSISNKVEKPCKHPIANMVVKKNKRKGTVKKICGDCGYILKHW